MLIPMSALQIPLLGQTTNFKASKHKQGKTDSMSQSWLIADRTLWDSLGNKCRIELHRIGEDTFELYASAYGSVPARRVGKLGELNSWADCWIAHRKEEGFMEQLPSYDPAKIN